jgi:hypothetical protein
MVEGLLLGLEVPRQELKEYTERPEKEDCFLVGVADPTGALPPGHVFVTGLPQLHRAFVTRCPCVDPTDGHIFPTVHHRPGMMSEEDWKWLQALPLGAIIFSGQGSQPLPSLCAGGDLDGDYYFVCWNERLLEVMHPRVVPAPHPTPEPQPSVTSFVKQQQRNTQWLAQVQAHMLDMNVMRESCDIGKIYTEWEKEKDAHWIAHPDALALGAAYTRSLERGKHGGAIELPDHLAARVWGANWKKVRQGKKEVTVETQTLGPSDTARELKSAKAPQTPERVASGRCGASQVMSRGEVLEMKLSELKEIIDRLQLDVKKNVGGKGRRTREQMAEEVAQACDGLGLLIWS